MCAVHVYTIVDILHSETLSYLWPNMLILCLDSLLFWFWVAIPVLPAAEDDTTLLAFNHIPEWKHIPTVLALQCACTVPPHLSFFSLHCHYHMEVEEQQNTV